MSDKRYRITAGKVYEFRHYQATPGKLEAMHKRHEDSILRLWGRHGVRLVGYWIPTFGGFTDELIYVCEWDSLDERNRIWSTYLDDPEWQEIWRETDKKYGVIHGRVHTELWRAAPYVPEPLGVLAAVRKDRTGDDQGYEYRIKQGKLYEYRRYAATPGNVETQHRRFETGVLPMLARHGVKLVGTWIPTFGGFTDELIQIQEWDSLADRERVWKEILQDPEWQSIKEEADKNEPVTARVHTELWRAASYALEPRATPAALRQT
ncbi:NIPSNAP family protein [Bradyrhizobium sp. USDA 4504]